jgi:hypothetical protein
VQTRVKEFDNERENVMMKISVKAYKGLVNRRQRGKPLDSSVVDQLAETFGRSVTTERFTLATQWVELREQGVPLDVISHTYGVSVHTICKATADPKKWSVTIGRQGGRCLGVPKKRKTKTKLGVTKERAVRAGRAVSRASRPSRLHPGNTTTRGNGNRGKKRSAR